MIEQDSKNTSNSSNVYISSETRLGDVMVGASAPGPGGQCFERSPSHTTDLNMVRAASLLNAQHIKS